MSFPVRPGLVFADDMESGLGIGGLGSGEPFTKQVVHLPVVTAWILGYSMVVLDWVAKPQGELMLAKISREREIGILSTLGRELVHAAARQTDVARFAALQVHSHATAAEGISR